MAVPTGSTLANVGQYPLNAVGPKGQQAFVGVHKVFFGGSTGLVGTGYGIPGVVATRISTGLYALRFPSAKSLDIFPALQCPTGNIYDVNVQNVGASSGYAEIQISRTAYGPTGSAGAPSLMVAPANPVTGTILNLMFFVAPVTPY